VVAGAYGLNFAVKVVVRRPRPELPGLPPLTPTVSRLSFPSAHATTSFAAARAYAGLAPPAALYAAAAAFAVSRPYLGVHYPSDVLAGAALGTLVAGVWPAGAGRPGVGRSGTGGVGACR
jgi:membrane-associated phospholipid phosphatase